MENNIINKIAVGNTNYSLEPANKVTSWQSTVSDDNFPTEKLVKDGLDTKLTGIKFNVGNPDVFIGYNHESNASPLYVATFKNNNASNGLAYSSISSFIINNVTSTSTTDALSANMGKELQTQISNLQSRGRFLSLWNCTTGLPTTNPVTSGTYAYRTGDYYVVSVVGASNNKKPNGASYDGSASTTAAESGVAVNDTYLYDGSSWILQKNTVDGSAFVTNVSYDNGKLKQTKNGTTSDITSIITTETQLSKGTTSGTGNAVTDINVSNHEITLIKGSSFSKVFITNKTMVPSFDSQSTSVIITGTTTFKYLTNNGNTTITTTFDEAGFAPGDMILLENTTHPNWWLGYKNTRVTPATYTFYRMVNTHTSTSTDYGVGTTSVYGHVKTQSGDMYGTTSTSGIAAGLGHFHSQYLTEHQSLDDYATKTWVTNKGYTTNTGTVTSVSAGTGLTGGPITTSGSLSVSYGTSAGTACQGNDSRLSNSRTPVAHASTETTYGVGTTTNYGHIKTQSGDMNGTSSTNGIAAGLGHTHSQYLTSAPSISITNSGSGNAVTAITASGHTLTVTKGSSFAASSHTHTKSQITDFPSSMPASDVYSWAKASSKPSYSFSEISSRGEAYLDWGGRNLAGSVSPCDAAIEPAVGGNKWAFASAASFTIQYSTNSGSTWTDYGASNDDKRKLTSTTASFTLGKGSTTSYAANRLRIIFNSNIAGGNVYTSLRKILIYLSTNGATGTQVIAEYKTIDNYNKGNDTWDAIGTYSVSGWSGWNSIPYNCSFGGGSTQTAQTAQIRLTFTQTGGTNNMSVYQVKMIGLTNWTSPSTMASSGHLYSFDVNQNATFPASVSATSFTENGTALSTKYVPKSAFVLSGTTLAITI